VTKAVILAAGRGTRMRAPDDSVNLTPEQHEAAEHGLKAMVPVPRPFLDHVLSAVADAGFTEVCLVVAPEHGAIRDRYARDGATSRLRVHAVNQLAPLGSADALLAAEGFAAGEPFVVLNGDNWYPPDALAQLRAAEPPATLAFARDGLLRDGAIPADRIASYAILDVDADGFVRRVTEKPPAESLHALGPDARVSMTCWLFDARIFDACRAVEPSPRGELELPSAVQYAIDHLGVRVRALPVDAPVLDLSRRADIPVVSARLAGVPVAL
jgi:glucose-1-phosphate thymidylyltransferase